MFCGSLRTNLPIWVLVWLAWRLSTARFLSYDYGFSITSSLICCHAKTQQLKTPIWVVLVVVCCFKSVCAKLKIGCKLSSSKILQFQFMAHPKTLFNFNDVAFKICLVIFSTLFIKSKWSELICFTNCACDDHKIGLNFVIKTEQHLVWASLFSW